MMSLFYLPCPLLKRALGLLAGAAIAFHGLAQAADETPANGMLWEVKSATNTAYLFGSFHLAKASFYPLPAAVQQAYQQADTVAVEIDSEDAGAAQKALPYFTYNAPDQLKNHLRPQTWRKLESWLGAAVSQVQQFKPAVVATSLSIGVFTQQGYDTAQGIDVHFIRRAKADHKQVIELESMAFQAQVLGGLSDEDGDAALEQTLDGLRSGELLRETTQMVNAWKEGNADALVQILQQTADKDAGSKKMMKLLLDDRNPLMAQQIVALIRAGKKVLVVVGAGHIAGRHSISDLLQQQGFQVRELK